MADLVTRLKLANSEFNSSINDSKQKVKEFQDTADDASKSLKEMGDKGAKSASEILNEISHFEQGGRSVTNYRKQLAQLQKQIVDLTVNYRSMSAEMQQSAKGMEVKALLDEATQQAAIFKDAIGDVQQEISKMASDTVIWDGMKQGIQTVSSSLQAFAAAGILGEKSTEKLVAVIAKLKGIEAATNSIIQIGTMLQKNSATMAAISTIQAKALARAKVLESTATKGATIAQRLFNKAASANPYVILAAAVLSVGAALVAFTKHSKEAKEEQERQNAALEKAKEKYEDYKSTVGGAVGDVVGKFRSLQVSYKNLSTEMEKKKWIDENKTAFSNLGLAITDVNSADEIFVKNSDAVIAALKARARANALQTMYEKEYTKQIEAEIEAQKKLGEAQTVTAGKKYGTANGDIPNDWKNAGLNAKDIQYEWAGGQSGAGWYTLSPEQAKKVNEYYKNLAKEAGDAMVAEASSSISTLESMWEDAERDAAAAAANVHGLITKPNNNGNDNGGSNTKIKPEIVPDEGSLAAAQKLVQELQSKVDNMDVNAPEFEEWNNKLKAAKAEVERLQALINGTELKPKEVEIIPEGSMAEAQHFIKVFQDQLNSLDPATDEFKEVLELLNIWKKRQEEINNIINGTKEEVKSTVDQYREIESKASDVSLQLKIGAIDRSTADKMIEDLNNKLEGLGLTARVKLEVDEASVKTSTDILKGYVEQMDKIASVGNGVSAINSVYESISGLSDKLEEAQNGWESFFAIFQTGMTIFNAVTTIIETLATVTELLTAAKTANAAATNAEATADATAAGAATSLAAAKLGEAGATGAVTAAKAGESVASIPVAGAVLAPIAIAAVLAAIIAAIASLSKFESGGVVGGSSFKGDKVLARVNSGEMILNQKQQGNLFKMLNEGRSSNDTSLGGNVTFRISGSDLVGTLNNYNHKTSRI